MKRQILHITILMILLAIGSCTVQYSMGGANIEPDVKTLTIDDFPNRAPSGPAGLDQFFTNELKDRFQSQTSLKLVENRGDLEFSGSITDYYTRPQAVGGDERASQTRLTITVHVKFTNKKHPDNSFETDFSQYADFSADQNLADVEDQLVEDITEKLIDDVFNKAVVNW